MLAFATLVPSAFATENSGGETAFTDPALDDAVFDGTLSDDVTPDAPDTVILELTRNSSEQDMEGIAENDGAFEDVGILDIDTLEDGDESISALAEGEIIVSDYNALRTEAGSASSAYDTIKLGGNLSVAKQLWHYWQRCAVHGRPSIKQNGYGNATRAL
jgi:hypothetical protein